MSRHGITPMRITALCCVIATASVSADLAGLLGGSDWTEGWSCDLLSNDSVKVQVLRRSGIYLAPVMDG